MILTQIQIQSLILCAVLLFVVILVGSIMIREEINEERRIRDELRERYR